MENYSLYIQVAFLLVIRCLDSASVHVFCYAFAVLYGHQFGRLCTVFNLSAIFFACYLFQ